MIAIRILITVFCLVTIQTKTMECSKNQQQTIEHDQKILDQKEREFLHKKEMTLRNQKDIQFLTEWEMAYRHWQERKWHNQQNGKLK